MDAAAEQVVPMKLSELEDLPMHTCIRWELREALSAHKKELEALRDKWRGRGHYLLNAFYASIGRDNESLVHGARLTSCADELSCIIERLEARSEARSIFRRRTIKTVRSGS